MVPDRQKVRRDARTDDAKTSSGDNKIFRKMFIVTDFVSLRSTVEIRVITLCFFFVILGSE